MGLDHLFGDQLATQLSMMENGWQGIALWNPNAGWTSHCDQHFPQTCRALKNIDIFTRRCVFPDANDIPLPVVLQQVEAGTKIYRLRPGAKLKPHYGSHGRLVVHVGLIV